MPEVKACPLESGATRGLAAQCMQILLISTALMLFEVNLVRLFSILTYYHLAFFVLAIALFGIGIGGLYGHIFRARMGDAFPKLVRVLPLCLAVSVLACSWLLLKMPLKASASEAGIEDIRWVLAAFLVTAIPFFFGSLFISSIFAGRTEHANRLYFSDLLGASAGCLLAVASLNVLGGLNNLFLIAALAASPFAFEPSVGRKARVGALAVALAGVGALALLNQTVPLYRISVGLPGSTPLFSKWNFFSFISLEEFPDWHGWRPSKNFTGPVPRHVRICQDGRAPAFAVEFDGDLKKVDYLRHDVTAMPWEAAAAKKALVVGAGGGRDLLTGKVYGVPDVEGVELNPTTVEAMRGPFRSFSGGIYDSTGVRVFNDNGRTFISHSTEQYDLIMTSLADTQLANSQGAFVLSENYLYTVEAYGEYLKHLTPGGVIGTVSSVYWGGQLFRLIGTASAALEHMGVADPSRHILVVLTPAVNEHILQGMSIIVGRNPLTPETINRTRQACTRLGYELAWAPDGGAYTPPPGMVELMKKATRDPYVAAHFADLSPLVDDHPYLYYPMKPGEFFKSCLGMGDKSKESLYQLSAFHVLINLFLAAFVSVLILMLSPLVLFRGRDLQWGLLKLQGAFLLVFFLLGAAYMLVEISLLQRFFLLLGDPTLTFAVVLCAMLAFTGVGSLIAGAVSSQRLRRFMAGAALASVALQLTLWLAGPVLFSMVQGGGLPMKFAVVTLMVGLMATPMGMLFPSALRLAGFSRLDITCWGWGMNGVGSVLGSVGATLLSINFGIQVTFFAGILLYALVFAALALLFSGRQADAALQSN